jgi:hypothetical protein
MPEEQVRPKDLPSVSLKKIFTLRDKLVDDVGVIFYGEVLHAAKFNHLFERMQDALPSGIPAAALHSTLLPLLDKKLIHPDFHAMAWRIAGNLDTLKKGKSVPAWSGTADREWAPIVLTRVYPVKLKDGKITNEFVVKFLGGSPCGETAVKYWSSKFLPVLARRIGFGGYSSNFKYRDRTDLINLTLLVKLSADKCRRGRPGFEEVYAPGNFIKWNQDILRLRFRIGEECPRYFNHECRQCYVGLRNCNAAVRLYDLEKKFCTRCQSDKIFDPDASEAICVDCFVKFKLEGKK